jgi:hypothetical protein
LGLVLKFYPAWDDSGEIDLSTSYNDTNSYDLDADASTFLDSLFATHVNSYVPTGTRISPLITFNIGGAAITNTKITWDADIPTGTSVSVYTSIDYGQTWYAVNNGDKIPGITPGSRPETVTIQIKQVLSTSNPLITPTINSTTVQVSSNISMEQVEWLPQGVFPCTSPIASSAPDKNEVTLQGPDKMSFLGTTTDNLTIAKGTDIATAIKTVLNGIETKFLLDDTSGLQTVPYDMTWPIGTDYAKVISDLASILTWEIYYDVNGYLRLHAPIDPVTTPPMFTIDTTMPGFNVWAGADREMDDSQLANYIVVYGGGTQTGFVSYIMQDDDPNSPTSIQRIGKRPYVHNNGNPDPVIVTTDLARYRAEYEYKKRLQIVEKLNFNMFPMPFMEQDDVYQIEDPRNGTTGKYQVVNFTIPLQIDGTMHTGYLWQVRNFA